VGPGASRVNVFLTGDKSKNDGEYRNKRASEGILELAIYNEVSNGKKTTLDSYIE
jgi:hypothetical protein